MSSAPLRRRVVGALQQFAEDSWGPGATPLDYVVAWVAEGGTWAGLAAQLALEADVTCSRSFVSFVARRLGPNARERIDQARKLGQGCLPDCATAQAQVDGMMGLNGEATREHPSVHGIAVAGGPHA